MLSDILSRDEIAYLLARNVANPELGRPVYVCWTANTPTSGGPDTSLGQREDVCLRTWTRQLHSKTWRVQKKGAKFASIVERPIRKQGGGWNMVPLNARSK